MRFFGYASTRSKIFGAYLSGLHLLISFSVIISLATHEPDSQWQLIWIIFFPFDFPFSLVTILAPMIISDFSIYGLRYPLGEVASFIVPAFIHGIIGPIWYYFIPVLISHYYNVYSQKRKNPISQKKSNKEGTNDQL